MNAHRTAYVIVVESDACASSNACSGSGVALTTALPILLNSTGRGRGRHRARSRRRGWNGRGWISGGSRDLGSSRGRRAATNRTLRRTAICSLAPV
jgi:hypothetical protein